MYCHLNVKTGSRATGQSAAAKYDYISRDGRYARACQDEVVHIESGSMPGIRVVGRASVLGGGRRTRAQQRPAVPVAHRGAAQLAGPGGAARAGAELRRARDGGSDALHPGRARRPVEGAGGGKQPAPAPGVLRAGERRGGAGGGAVGSGGRRRRAGTRRPEERGRASVQSRGSGWRRRGKRGRRK